MPSQRVETLLKQMTLREKAGQMTQVTLDTVTYGKPYKVREPLEIDPLKLNEFVTKGLVGSLLNVGTYAHTTERWQALIDQIQEAAAQTRLKIPVLYGIDTIHGANYVMGSTLFPQQLGLAATGNPELVADLFEMATHDTVRAGLPWLFSPVGDVGRKPSWPRLWEGFGEDVYQAAVLTKAATEGIERVEAAASCLKHFLGYGYTLSGKDRTPAWIPERQLREYFLPPFVEAIKAGAQTMMINSGEINGVPIHANKQLLTDMVRGELGFDGVLVTDWEDILYLHSRHRIADSYRTAVKIAIDAGIDMSMTPIDTEFADHVVDLVSSGELTEARIDESVRRILTLKERLGLFEQANPGKKYPAANRQADLALAEKAAEQSIILLRNEEATLPFSKQDRILVVGPTAATKKSLHGGWTYTWQGERIDELDPTHHFNLLQAIQAEWGSDKVTYIPGCDFDGNLMTDDLAEAAAYVDKIVLCLGESSYTEFFGSLDDLHLPDEQLILAEEVIACGKPIALVLLQGRPRVISRFDEDIPAILTAFYPGHGGARALAGVLAGRVNPSGRLPITYPRHPNNLMAYDHKSTENQELQGAKPAFNPAFEFGHGLSYASFQYHDLALDKTTFSAGQTVRVEVSISNVSDLAGEHIVQLYSRDHFASVTPCVRRLRKFQRIALAAGETQKVDFSLTAKDLAFVGLDMKWVTEPGTFSVMIEELEVEVEYAG